MGGAKSDGKTDDSPQVEDVRPTTVNADTPFDNADGAAVEEEKDGGKSPAFASGSAAQGPVCASSTPPIRAVASSVPTVDAPSMPAFVISAPAPAFAMPASRAAPPAIFYGAKDGSLAALDTSKRCTTPAHGRAW